MTAERADTWVDPYRNNNICRGQLTTGEARVKG